MTCNKTISWTILLSVWILAVITIWQASREFNIAQNLYISTLEAQDVKNARRWPVNGDNPSVSVGKQIAPKTKLGALTPQIEGVAWKTRLSEYPILIKIAFCESGLNPNAYSWDGGAEARGLFQITRKYWPDITDEQAFNPDWSLNWAIEKMKAGQLYLWACYKNQLKNYQ